MNEATHFLTGYLIGRLIFKRKNTHFLPFFCGIAAILPDIDQALHLIIPLPPFEHAVFTHTIIGTLLLTLILIGINWAIGSKFFKNIDINFKLICLVALSGSLSHLFLDVFTYRENIWTTDAHLYFWPVWNFSFHLNAFFHQSIFPNIYTIRIAIEVVYTAIIGIYILFYQWAYKKENPLSMFSPKQWLSHLSEQDSIEENRSLAYILFIINISLLALMALGFINYF